MYPLQICYYLILYPLFLGNSYRIMRALMVTRIIMMLPLANGINTYVLHSYKIIHSNGTSTMTIILI